MTQMNHCRNGHLIRNIFFVNRKRNCVSWIVVKWYKPWSLTTCLLTHASLNGFFRFLLKRTMFLVTITWGGFTLRFRFKKFGYQNILSWTLTCLLYRMYSDHHIVKCIWWLVIVAYLAKLPDVQTELPNHVFLLNPIRADTFYNQTLNIIFSVVNMKC
jgi:hypothetical protein